MHQVVRTIYRQHRRTLFGILFGLVFSTIVAYATPPGSAYTPGETLDPTCDPGSTNCTVAIDNSRTLQAVTDVGNTTTNSITVQGATITANATKESIGFGIGIGNPAAGIGNTFIGYRTGEGITGGDAVTLIGEMNGINQSSTDVVAIGSNNFYQNSGNATYALGDGNGFNNSFSNVVFLGTNGTATADKQLVFSTDNNPTLLSPVARFDFNALSDNRQYNLPDADGTLALTSNLSSWLTGTLTGDVAVQAGANSFTLDADAVSIGGHSNVASGIGAATVGGQHNTATGQNAVVLGGSNITGSADDTVYALYMHVGSTGASDSTTLLTLEDADSTCTFTANTGGPVCGSDQTLKKDITNLSSADLLARVSLLTPVSYHWRTDTDGAAAQYGFIAQDVAQQFPELVTDRTWIDGTTRKFLNMGGLMPYAIGAIKELNIRTMALPAFDDMTLAGTVRAFLEGVAQGTVRSKQLCAEDVCVDKAELQQLLEYVRTH